MKNLTLIAVAVLGIAFTSISCSSNMLAKEKKLTTDLDSAAYYIGASIGSQMSGDPVLEGIDIDIVAQGLKAAFDGEAPEQMEISQFLNNFYQQKQMEKAQAAVAEGEAFLEENGKKPGVITTESGLQYKVVKEGTGKQPSSAQSTVLCHYEGRLIDGKVFDSSYERGEPTSFPLSGVIAGWTEGIQLMKEGAEYEFYIPSEMAYGQRPPSPDIPANAVLIFKVELVEVQE